MRSWWLLSCLLLSCAAPDRRAWLASARARGEGLCWWRDVRWEDRGRLRLRGSGEPFARVRALQAGDTWRGASLTGTLRRAGPVVLLQGRWEGEGLTVEADVDVGADAVVTSWEQRRIGEVGLLLKGARVRLFDANVGSALAVPAEDALRVFEGREPLAVEMTCENLSLRGFDELPEQQVARAGFPGAEAASLVPGPPVDVFEAPGGELRGHVVPEAARSVFLLQRSGALARVAVPTESNLVWVGWVDGARVKAAGPVDSPVPSARPLEPATARVWRSCGAPLTLAVKTETGPRSVGTLAAGTAFSIEESREPWLSAVLSVEWFQPEPGVRLLLPEEARRCNPISGAW